MAVQVKPEQAYAYAELLEILGAMDKAYIAKIPKKLMAIFKENALSTYEKHIDINVPLEEQKISKKTSALIAMLTVQYWCETKEQKEELLNVFKENERKYQEELREKYNPDNIFNKETSENMDDSINEIGDNSSISIDSSFDENSGMLMDYNSFPWYKKIFTKVKLFVFNIFKNFKKAA